jgi:hypothetical protein
MRPEAFVQAAAGLTIEQWRTVYDKQPLGYRTAHSRLASVDSIKNADVLLRKKLGDSRTAESRGRGRGNFLAGCRDRLVAAYAAIASTDKLSGCDFVSGYGPFLALIPPEKLGVSTPIGDLVDIRVRSEMLASYRRALSANAGRVVASPGDLPSNPERIATALALESISATHQEDATLEDELVQLCSFTGSTPEQVHDCQVARLRWLGYNDENLATLHGRAVSVGGHGASSVAAAETFQQWFYGVLAVSGLLGVGSCEVLSLKGSQLSALLGVAGCFGGIVGALTGVWVDGFVEARTNEGTRSRLLGRVGAMAAACAVPMVMLVGAFLVQGSN